MTIAIIAAVLIVVAALVFTVARRALRLMVRLALVGALLLAALIGMLYYWYQTSDSLTPQNTRTPTTNRPSARNANSR
ncbi:MAG: hypothetical protein H0V88_09060 [Pyrinomonadaceae bacterium]|nr:hypothetical protein [Pyrinomonadaceae bacterium]